MKRSREAKTDPVVTEIVRNGVIAVTEEMKTNLMRTAYNMIIYELSLIHISEPTRPY